MKKLLIYTCLIALTFMFYACPFSYSERKYPQAYFPSVPTNLSELNSEYDDINMDLPIKFSSNLIIFSSNRKTNGSTFDIVGDKLTFKWDMTDGDYGIDDYANNDFYYLQNLLDKVNTNSDEYGPFSTIVNDTLYLFYANNSKGTNDVYFYRYFKTFKDYYNIEPADSLIEGPFSIPSLSNPGFNEGYVSLHTEKPFYGYYNLLNTDGNLLKMVYCSDSLGQFDIYSINLLTNKNSVPKLTKELISNEFVNQPEFLSSVNSEYNDRCPYVCGNFMVFSSDRPGGLGGYDFYYSIYKNGQWTAPVNLGEPYNTEFDEYRAIIFESYEFENDLLIFSSDRPGGSGGFDIWYMGTDLLPNE